MKSKEALLVLAALVLGVATGLILNATLGPGHATGWAQTSM